MYNIFLVARLALTNLGDPEQPVGMAAVCDTVRGTEFVYYLSNFFKFGNSLNLPHYTVVFFLLLLRHQSFRMWCNLKIIHGGV